jgi:flagellar protein FlbD
MIRLTRLNQQSLVVNAELIKFVEETPDTVITLRNNEKVLVKERADEVVARAIEYARAIRWLPGV